MAYSDDDNAAMEQTNALLAQSQANRAVVPNRPPLPPAGNDVAQSMGDANAIQQQSYAARPVVPNAAAGPIAAYNGEPPQFDQSGAVVAPPRPFFAPGTFSSDNAYAYGPDVQGGRTVTAAMDSAPNASVDASALRPRPMQQMAAYSPQITGMEPTPVADAAARSMPVPERATPGAGVFSSGIYNNPNEAGYAAQNAAYRAREDQNLQDQRNATINGLARSAQQQDLTREQGAQRVARFNAENARLDVAGNIGGEGRYAAADLAEKAAQGADADVNATRSTINGINTASLGNRNYIDEFQRGQEGLGAAQRSQIAGQAAPVELATKVLANQTTQQQLATGKQLTALRTQLANETDPNKQYDLSQKLLAIEGKAPQQDKFALGDIDTGYTTTDPLTGREVPIYKKTPIDMRTGQPAGPTGKDVQSKATKYPAPGANAIALLKQNAKDPDHRAMFDKQFGPGAAAKVLGG